MLPREHRALALDTPVIAAEPAVAAQHAVAGNQPGDRIRADGLADRPARAGAADRLGQRPIARRPAGAEFEQRLPDLDLEVRADRREHDAAPALAEDLARDPRDRARRPA